MLVAMAAVPAAAAACGGTERYRAKPPRSGERTALAIGDSVMLGAVTQLTRRGFEVDVAGCRQFSQGLSVLAARGRSLPRVVVIALGTNWTVEQRQVRRALIILGRRRVLGLVTPREVGGARSSDQAVMRAASERWPRRVKLLDWVRYSRGHANWFWADGLHLQPRGARALRRLMAPALKWPPPDYDEPPPPSTAPAGDLPPGETGSGEARADSRAETEPGPGPVFAWAAIVLLIAAIGMAAVLNAGPAPGAESR